MLYTHTHTLLQITYLFSVNKGNDTNCDLKKEGDDSDHQKLKTNTHNTISTYILHTEFTN